MTFRVLSLGREAVNADCAGGNGATAHDEINAVQLLLCDPPAKAHSMPTMGVLLKSVCPATKYLDPEFDNTS
jgi:hypothetical protein